MATTTLTLSSERWLDEQVFTALVADAGAAPIVESFVLPSGNDDVAIMSVMVSIVSVATVPVVATFDRGVRAVILSQDAATNLDIVGCAQFFATGGSGAAFDRFDAMIDPDALCLFRRNELLTIAAPEMDAGVTADVRILVKAVRVRPMESAGLPLQLVR